MDTTDYLALVKGGVGTFGIEWATEPKPAAAHRARRLRKVTTAVCMTGVSFANLRENADRETGELPWGEWSEYPYVITHKGADYFRLNVVDGSIRTTYLVDGDVVDRDTFSGYLTPSAANAPRPIGGTITVKASNLRAVGEPSFR